MVESEVALGGPFSGCWHDGLGSGAFKLSMDRRCRHFTTDAQQHLCFAAFDSNRQSQRNRLCQGDRDRRAELVRNNPGEVAAMGNSWKALVALVDVELIQLRAF